MRIVPVLGVLEGGEGVCPPLPYLDVSDEEGASLIERGLVLEYVDPDALRIPVELDDAMVPTSPVLDVVPATVEPDSVVVQASADVPTATTERQAEIIDHIELLGPEDYVKTGPRAGKPLVKPLADALGWSDLTAEEVDAAFALKEAGQPE